MARPVNPLSGDHASTHRRRPAAIVAIGLICAAVAIALRLLVRGEDAGAQAIFSYPAILAATLLAGSRAGAFSAGLCFVALWYYVIPPEHSFLVGTVPGAITLAVYLLVSVALVWSAGQLRDFSAKFHALNMGVHEQAEAHAAERSRIWSRSKELVAILKHDGAVHALNPAFMRLLKADHDHVVGCNFADLIENEDRREFTAAQARLGLDADSVTFETRIRTAAGQVARVIWSGVHDADNDYLVGRISPADRTNVADLRAEPGIASLA